MLKRSRPCRQHTYSSLPVTGPDETLCERFYTLVAMRTDAGVETPSSPECISLRTPVKVCVPVQEEEHSPVKVGKTVILRAVRVSF